MTDLFAHARQKALRPPPVAAPAEPASATDHPCAVCGGFGVFGFGVSLRLGKPGRWSCLKHREQVERMV